MKFPYGICDFRKIIKDGYFYCDRTDRIPLLEKGTYQIFLRPRRFGKSLLLSMLTNYYDIARKDAFQDVFGHLKIGKNPTPLHSSYFILEWDFSCVDPSGSAENIKKALHTHINGCIRSFAVYYREFLKEEIRINPDDAIDSIRSLITAVRMTEHPLYLLIDEYDNFANEVMMGIRREKGIYEALVYEEGALKTLFKAVKSSTKDSVFDRIFITGVSPVVMSDITSGYNIADNIYLNPVYNDMCGFHGSEIADTVKQICRECGFGDSAAEDAVHLMKTYYNGYIFSPEADTDEKICNPTLAIYFLKAFHETCKPPRKMLDANLATDDAKLRFISGIPGGSQLLLDIVEEQQPVVTSDLEDRFGIQRMLSGAAKDNTLLISFLYYFGVLTLKGQTEIGELEFRVPNLVIQGLYAERIREMLLPEPMERDAGVNAAKLVFQEGDMAPICEFIETRYFSVFRNRDYRWANELTVKTAFLTLLYNEILYIMDSEPEAGRTYADLTMIIRPDMRKFKIFDVLIEFKYVSLKKAGLSGDQAKSLSVQELREIPEMKSEMEAAKKQIKSYGDELEKKYKALRLKRFAVVSLGFERLWWETEGYFA
ncbi:MAG: AAA family ATPase [Desulfobacterales bacterium]